MQTGAVWWNFVQIGLVELGADWESGAIWCRLVKLGAT